MRLIDADALAECPISKGERNYRTYNLDDAYEDGYYNAMADIRNAPTIYIVFCENCRECVEKGVGVDCPSGYGYLYCRRKKSVVDETDFCSWGIEK